MCFWGRTASLHSPIIVIGDGKADAQIVQDLQADVFIQAAYYRDTKLSDSPFPPNWYRAETIEQLSDLLFVHMRNEI